MAQIGEETKKINVPVRHPKVVEQPIKVDNWPTRPVEQPIKVDWPIPVRKETEVPA